MATGALSEAGKDPYRQVGVGAVDSLGRRLKGKLPGKTGTPVEVALYGLYGELLRFARTLAAELKDRGIRIDVLSPGPIDTPLVADVPPDTVKQLIASIPLGRMGKPEEVAQAALFLASSESSFVNGIELFVDGGCAQI